MINTKFIDANKILALIPTGKDNAISMEYLSNILGVSKRDIRQCVLNARLEGNIICGTQYGYYLPADDSELREYYYYALTRALTTLKSLKTARIKVKEIEAELSDAEQIVWEELKE